MAEKEGELNDQRVHWRWRIYALCVTGFLVGYMVSDWGLLG